MSNGTHVSGRGKTALLIFGVILVLLALPLIVGGVKLIALGGSWYYLLAGAGLLVSGYLFARRNTASVAVFALVVIATIIWSLIEVGLNFWTLVPRLSGVLVLSVPALLLAPYVLSEQSGKVWRRSAGGLVVALLVAFGAMFFPHGVTRDTSWTDAPAALSDAAKAATDWSHYGRTSAGTRFVPFDQINKDNVGQLDVAWTFQTGEVATKGSENQNTPLQIGDTVYVCTPLNKVFALDAETGVERWKYDPQIADRKVWNRCRGVSYVDASANQATTANAQCAQRIVTSTIDANLIALDAKTGQLCEGFGNKGVVDLKVGLGEIKPNYYMPTSAPTVANGMIVIGGWVYDGREVSEPSGVVRAFDAITGELAWAWDLGNPDITKLPPEGQTYSRGTPNVWTTPAVDEKLGLIYLPTGNGTPDYWGGHRTKAMSEYASSIVALDIKTGKERWKFQTTHYDVWDYDIASQPALHDIPNGAGEKIPAIIQITKRGQIFVLDRRDGKPIAEVQEKPVPQGGPEAERLSPTQPYSVGMPAIGVDKLTEEKMWGATFYDQLWCRIEYRKLGYEGEFTPPTTERATLQYPGNYGGFNWGSASIDESRDLLVVNDIRMPQIVQLVSHELVKDGLEGHNVHPQKGVPYAEAGKQFMSPLGVPCHAPPYGTMTAIDLKTSKIVWQTPMSTLKDTGPLGMKTNLSIPIGMPTMGGPVTTASGLIFFAGTQDYYLRAIDSATGKELWKGRLPVGVQAAPASYVSPKSGRQFVVVSAGGARQSPDRGDYVIAYALPKHE